MAVQQRPTWLNQLPSHSIFELDEQEYLEWSRINSRDNTKTSTPSTSSLSGPRPGTSQRASFGLEDLQEEYQRANQGLSCMVVYRQDMYVAVGRQIRYANLSDLKSNVENHGRAAAAEYIESKQHKVGRSCWVDKPRRCYFFSSEEFGFFQSRGYLSLTIPLSLYDCGYGTDPQGG